MLLQICRDHGLVPTPDPNVNRNNVIVARTPPGARTTMETRLRLGRHPVKGEMLVLEYSRWETEAAAVQGECYIFISYFGFLFPSVRAIGLI
jgi:hypothetical protein